MATEAAEFVARYSVRLHGAETELNKAYWDLETIGNEETKTAVIQGEIKYNAILQSGEDWNILKSLHERAEGDGALARQLDILYREFLRNRDDPDRFEQRARLQTEIAGDFTAFRAKFEGREVSDNDLNIVLREDRDSARVEAAWRAGKQIGPVIADRVVELAELRNASARAQGFSDFYVQQLELQEVDVDSLFSLLNDLEELTREPFRVMKGKLDATLAAKFGVPVSELMPWHYGNPFFQEPPAINDVSLDRIFGDGDVTALAVRTFEQIGLPVDGIIARSDLFERPGKNQHAFCLTVDRLTSDVRVLCNLRPDEYSMTTMLHELGHAVYEEYMGRDLPFLLRTPAHINSTEAIAMLMGRLTRNAEWLSDIAEAGDVRALADASAEQLSAQMLTFVRWVLVMSHFERALFANPRRPDLNQLWWELVEKYQMLRVPEDRVESAGKPDWAAKIHIGLYPCYYHNYVLGELTASQIQDTLCRRLGDSWFQQSAAGEFLRDEMFALGARYPWSETVERVTGKPLAASYFAEQFVGALAT